MGKVFAAEDRRRKLAARALARSHVMDTRSALARSIHGLIEDANPDGEHARDIAAHPLDDDVPTGIWEDHPRLDLRMLASAGLMRPGELTGTTLLWDFEEGWDRVDVYIDLRRDLDPHLGLIRCKLDGFTHQAFEIVWPAPWQARRHQLRCAVTGENVEVLGYRHGRFAPRWLQRLVNRSQRRGEALQSK